MGSPLRLGAAGRVNHDMGVFPPITDVEKPDLDGSLVHGLAWTGGVRWVSQVAVWASTADAIALEISLI